MMEATVACFREVVPAAVPGIVFLSGGQDDEEVPTSRSVVRGEERFPELHRPKMESKNSSSAADWAISSISS